MWVWNFYFKFEILSLIFWEPTIVHRNTSRGRGWKRFCGVHFDVCPSKLHTCEVLDADGRQRLSCLRCRIFWGWTRSCLHASVGWGQRRRRRTQRKTFVCLFLLRLLFFLVFLAFVHFLSFESTLEVQIVYWPVETFVQLLYVLTLIEYIWWWRCFDLGN